MTTFLPDIDRLDDAVIGPVLPGDSAAAIPETATFNLAITHRPAVVVGAAGEPQAAAFRRGVVNRHPHGQLKDFAAIGRKDARILVVFHHERAGLVPLNGRRMRTFVKVLRPPHEKVWPEELGTALDNGRVLHVVPQSGRLEMPIARRDPAVSFRFGVLDRQDLTLEVHHFFMTEGIERAEEALFVELADSCLAELMLRRVWRRHPLAPWAKTIPGCGEKLVARLIAVVGDPSLRPVGSWARTENGGRVWVLEGYEE